jgi:hypothetical protein
MLIKELLEGHDQFRAALADMVRDEDETELSEEELKALVKKVAKAHGLNAAETKKLALAAEGPIGY